MGRIDLLFELEREQPWTHGPPPSPPPKPKEPEKLIAPAGPIIPPPPPPPPKPEKPKHPEKPIARPIIPPPKPKKPEKPKDSGKPIAPPRAEDKKKEPKLELPSKIPEKPKELLYSHWWIPPFPPLPDINDPETEIYKDYDLYIAAKTGNLPNFIQILDRLSSSSSLPDILSRRSPAGNTFFHIAAKFGKEEILNFLVEKMPSLVLFKNFKGYTALHLAAKAGDESIVKALVEIHRKLPGNVEDEHNLLRTSSENGNTALHEALSNGGNSNIAKYLIEKDPELSYCRNYYGYSALYLAAKTGFVDCVALILQLSTDEERINELFKRKSPIHAAIKHSRKDILEEMFKENPRLIQLRDENGRNPLHHAAASGSVRLVCYLLNKFAHNAAQRDGRGLFPIHLAAIEGHVDVVGLLLENCPDPEEILDRDDCNILHLAIIHGRSKVVNFILKNPDLKNLINMKNEIGNTPLHVAAATFRAKIVSTLTWDKRVDIKLTNNMGETALDVAARFSPFETQFKQILTWAALKAAGTPRHQTAKPAGEPKKSNIDSSKDMRNTLLLVATLVATVTFAAGFTVPGGYNSSDSDTDKGMATMLRDKGFHVFLFCDTIAMYSSIIVVVALIWAQFEDMALMLNALTLAVPFLTVALSMMSMAFMAGVFIVVSKLRWLGNAILVMGVAFLVLMFLLVLPLCTPLASRNRILRYLSYYPFCLLILVSSKSLAV